MTPDQYCEEKTRQSGSSFTSSFRILPRKKRQAMTALYAYCREVDDVVDECSDSGVARTTLSLAPSRLPKCNCSGSSEHHHADFFEP